MNPSRTTAQDLLVEARSTPYSFVMRSAMAAPMFLAVFLAIRCSGGGGGAGGKEESPPPDAWTPGTPVLDFGFVPHRDFAYRVVQVANTGTAVLDLALSAPSPFSIDGPPNLTLSP